VKGLAEKIAEAKSYLTGKWPESPQLGLILGTGLGGLAQEIDAEIEIPYGEIPHFPTSTVQSHAGQLVLGKLKGRPVVAMEGRFHYYEGYSLQDVTFPVRVMKALGIETLFITNAAGGMNPQYDLADVVIIEDHIDFLPDNPLRGVNDDNLGPRFPDMLEPYDRRLVRLAQDTALELGIPAHKGVFVAVSGPNLETRAEYRMLRHFGADVVGMSTVPEAIVAKHAGLRTAAFSIVTDLCLPDALEPVDIQKIIAVAGQGGERLGKLIGRMIEKLDDGI
jgi:purine-nucleoside phosphorylase